MDSKRTFAERLVRTDMIKEDNSTTEILQPNMNYLDINIDEMIQILQDAKSEGANRVHIASNEDH